MMQKSFSNDLNEAGADVSKNLYEQKKKFDDRFDQMEAMINDKFVEVGGSIQKLQASLSAMSENYLKISESVLN
uniref:Uncharacterized protein n=1 Tax=Ditylenchus dipsaci TaxID=166011 RepID=A0A915CMP2_9BILA